MDALFKRVTLALSSFDDGFLFEQWAQRLIAQIEGKEFIPYGGTGDGGLDGARYFSLDGVEHIEIYQFSIQKDYRSKMRNELKKLKDNGLSFRRFYYVTNQPIRNEHKIREELEDEFDVHISIRSLNWFCVHVEHSISSKKIFEDLEQQVFVTQSQEFPDQRYIVDITDPRVFAYLKQQLANRGTEDRISDAIIDSLIFLSLDGTDPDKEIRMKMDQIVARIQEIANFSKDWLVEKVSDRLQLLTRKGSHIDGGRSVNHHRNTDDYVLPYHKRLAIRANQAEDQLLHDEFNESVAELITEHLQNGTDWIDIQQAIEALQKVLHKLFTRLGTEFATFLSSRTADVSVDASLRDIVQEVVENEFKAKDSVLVVDAIFKTLRDIIYRGSESQLEYLNRLANTYRMLFVLQFDPKLAYYFEQVADSLVVYIDTSILLMAMSEHYLRPEQQRFGNLLIGAVRSGVKMYINQAVIEELVAHFKDTQRHFQNFGDRESDSLLEDELYILYVEKILIRAYLYAKMRGQVGEFRDFFETFSSWDLQYTEDELKEWILEKYGIKFATTHDAESKIDKHVEHQLIEELSKSRNSKHQARTDARQLLLIDAIRKINSEAENTSPLGYQTWWLTTDTFSLRALKNLDLPEFNSFRPYIRADFLYGCISLAPSRNEVDKVYQKLFPTLLGVNMSYHVPKEVSSTMDELIREHQTLLANRPRLKGMLKRLNAEIVSSPSNWNSQKIRSWWDDAIQTTLS